MLCFLVPKKRKKVQLRGVGSLASYQVHLCSNGHAPLAKALFSLNESPQLVFLPLGAVLLYALTVGSRAIEMEMWPIWSDVSVNAIIVALCMRMLLAFQQTGHGARAMSLSHVGKRVPGWNSVRANTKCVCHLCWALWFFSALLLCRAPSAHVPVSRAMSKINFLGLGERPSGFHMVSAVFRNCLFLNNLFV